MVCPCIVPLYIRSGLEKTTAATMATLQLAQKARLLNPSNKVATLYRAMAKEIPRVFTIYDIDIPVTEARAKLRGHFRKNGHIKDERILGMLIEKGYMELEETLLQWKQRPHLIRTFEGYIAPSAATRKFLGPNPTIEEQFNRE